MSTIRAVSLFSRYRSKLIRSDSLKGNSFHLPVYFITSFGVGVIKWMKYLGCRNQLFVNINLNKHSKEAFGKK